MLCDPNQSQPVPAREGERYSTINKTKLPIMVNGTAVYPQELATFVAQKRGGRLIWQKELPLD